MKGLFKIILAFGFLIALQAQEATGQIVNRYNGGVKDSVVNGVTKYMTFPSTPDGVTGFFATGHKAATGGGTVSAYAVLQVRSDTMPTAATAVWNDYIHPATGRRDTIFFTDGADPQGGQFGIENHYFNGARLKIVSSGTQKFYIWFGRLQRSP